MDRIHRMSRGRKTLLSLLLVGAIGAVAGIGTFSAFSATTVNAGNYFDAGTVVDLRQRRRQLRCTTSRMRSPAIAVVRCIQVTYTGSLDSTVSLYSSAVGAIGPFVNLTIDKGTGTDRVPGLHGLHVRGGPTSTRGRSAASPRRTPTSRNGSSATPGAQTVWNTNNTLVYRFTLTLQNNAGRERPARRATHSFTWEAQNV